MIIYNVTVKIDRSIQVDWLNWMIEKHIPAVMQTNLFQNHQICRLLEQNESDGISYAIRYECENMTDFFTYQKEFAPALQAEHVARYKDRFVAFRTLMRVIE
ncbi:MAG: DUF4286 family protein [Chitinophagales bacterium]